MERRLRGENVTKEKESPLNRSIREKRQDFVSNVMIGTTLGLSLLGAGVGITGMGISSERVSGVGMVVAGTGLAVGVVELGRIKNEEFQFRKEIKRKKGNKRQ